MLTRLLKSAVFSSSVHSACDSGLRSPSNRVSLARKWIGNLTVTTPPRMVSAYRLSFLNSAISTRFNSFVRYCSTRPNESSNPTQNRGVNVKRKIEALQRLFDQSQLDVTEKNEKGYDLAQFAAARGEVEVLQWMWERNLLDTTGSTSWVRAAVYYCQLDVLQWLYDTNVLDMAKAVKTCFLVPIAMRSVLDGVPVLQWLLDHELMDGSEMNELGNDLTEEAVALNKPDVLEWLKTVGFLDNSDARGPSILEEIAILNSALESLKWMEQNKMIDWHKGHALFECAKTMDAKLPSQKASSIIFWFFLKIVQFLVLVEENDVHDKILELQRHFELPAEVRFTSKRVGVTLATLAAARGDVDVLQWLWEGGLLDVEQKDANNVTVVITAVGFGQLEVLEWLHEKSLLNLNQKLSHGFTALTSCFVYFFGSELDVIPWLLERKLIDGTERMDPDGEYQGWNLTQLAVAYGKTRFLDWLEKQGLLDTLDSNLHKCTLPELAIERSQLESLKWLHSRKLLNWTKNREKWEKQARDIGEINILMWLECRRTLDHL